MTATFTRDNYDLNHDRLLLLRPEGQTSPFKVGRDVSQGRCDWNAFDVKKIKKFLKRGRGLTQSRSCCITRAVRDYKERPEQAGASQVSSSIHERQMQDLVHSRCAKYSLLLMLFTVTHLLVLFIEAHSTNYPENFQQIVPGTE